MFDVNSSRSYDSPLRDRAALQTRRAILAAAAQLFVEQGYVATTVDQIAQRAGVARPTVFAAAGNKRSLLKTIRDQALAGDDEPTPVAERAWYRETLNEPDARQSLRLYARNLVRISDRYADIEAVLQAAAAADAELAQLWRTNEDERRRGAEFIVEALLGKSPLRAGLTRDEAVDLLWSFAASSHYRRLVRDRGWPIDRYERWLTDTLCTQLLPPD